MKYNTDEALKEISRRGNLIKEKHNKRITHILSAATFVTAFVLVGALSVLSGTEVYGTQTAYGSFLLYAQAGGYVLTAVVSFMLGVIVTFLIQRFRSKGGTEQSED